MAVVGGTGGVGVLGRLGRSTPPASSRRCGKDNRGLPKLRVAGHGGSQEALVARNVDRRAEPELLDAALA